MAVTRELLHDRLISTNAGDRLDPSSSQSVTPIELRSNPMYPLLIDPDHKDAAEHFGVLRTRLLNARAKSGLCSVLVASAQKQEGKSLVSMNLAISLAQLAKDRVLLVDGDLRMKGITKILGLQDNAGLADFLQDRESFDACVKPTTLPSLSVAPAGNVLEESLPGVLEGSRWAEFLDRAKRDFGLIIVDSVPASAPIADFELLLAGCDTALLVVQLRKARWEALEGTSQKMNGKLLGIVVNNTEPPADFKNYVYSGGKGRR
jgi:capsular exopolysaccharide synthesis family protein